MRLPRIVSGPVSSLLARPVARYISAQRDHLEAAGTTIWGHSRARLADYFRPVDLDRVRIVERDPLQIRALPFTNTARRVGLDLPDVSLVAAITFDNIIASRQPLTSALLFHELVHAVQFRLLGVSAFAFLYVRGLLEAGRYDGIPLERCAVELDYRFEAERSPFDVEREVKDWIQRGLL
jgi:hypothetical protein